MNMKPSTLYLAAICLLCSCGIYHRYERPSVDVDIDSLFRNPPRQGDTTSIGALPWRGLFTDPCLQTLISTALERNTDLGVARLQVEEAQATLLGARLAYLPAVNLTPQAGISHYDGTTKKTYSLGAAATWEVDVFGRLTHAKRGAMAALQEREAYAQAVQTQLVATVAEAYYTLLMLDEQLAISRQTMTVWDETVRTLEALSAAGRATEVAVHQARASRTALDAAIASLQKSVSETENSLSALLREPGHAIGRSTLDSQHFADTLAVGLPVTMLADRPDVRQAEAALAEACYATQAARAAFFPTLTLSGSVGWTNSGGTGIVNPGKWLSSAIAQLTAPLFNRGTHIANLQIARAKQQEATLHFAQTLVEAGNEVNDALARWQTADKRIALDTLQIADLQAATAKTSLLVRYTSANYLEVLTAQQALLGAQLTLAQDRIDKILSVVQLYHALGGGCR